MGEPAKRRATYEDLLSVPENRIAEILDGELVTQPRPASRHARAASSLGGELYGPFDRGRGGPGGWIILDEPELHLHGDVVVPDLAGWRRSRMPELPDDQCSGLIDLAIGKAVSPRTGPPSFRAVALVYLRLFQPDPLSITCSIRANDWPNA